MSRRLRGGGMIAAFGIFGRKLTPYYPGSSVRQIGMSLMSTRNAHAKKAANANGKTRNASSQTWGN